MWVRGQSLPRILRPRKWLGRASWPASKRHAEGMEPAGLEPLRCDPPKALPCASRSIIDALVEAISWGFVFLLRGSSRYFCVRFVSHGLLASARLRPGQQGVELEAEPRPPLHRSGGVILQQASSGPRQWAQGFEEQARTGRPGSKPLRLLDPAKTRPSALGREDVPLLFIQLQRILDVARSLALPAREQT
jgi:hypothetical protein